MTPTFQAMSSNDAHDPKDASRIEKVAPPSQGSGEASYEIGLWNLDDEEPANPMPAKTIGPKSEGIPSVNPARVQRVIGSPSLEKKSPAVGASGELTKSMDSGDSRVRLNIQRQKDSSLSASQPPKLASFSHEFDDLEKWVDDGGEATGKEMEDAAKLAELDVSPPLEKQVPAVATVEPVAPAPVEPMVSEAPSETSNPVAARRQSNFSKLEKLGMGALIVALLAIFAGFLMFSVTRLPMESLDSRKVKFPIGGKLVTVRAANTYWRDVVQSGPEADVVRRGTRMLPVLELSCSEGPGVLRVLFRDENGDSVGDVITRQVTTEGKIIFAATAGFDEIGMHAAYRTGESKPWKIEVYEGGGKNVSEESFVKLFEMDISAERR